MKLLCFFCILHYSFAVREISDRDVRIVGVNSEGRCAEHCSSLTGCRGWTMTENECVVTLSQHVFVQGVSEDGVSLLQSGDPNCTMWRDPVCGWQVDTILYGGCKLDRASPDQCMGYCSDGCEYIQGTCEASCQPLVITELFFEVSNKLKLLQCLPAGFEAELRTELARLWGISDESYVELSASCESADTIRVIVTVIPHSVADPTTNLLDALADAVNNKLDAVEYPHLSKLKLLDCQDNCDICIGYCPSGLEIADTCSNDIPDGCGGICPDSCEGFAKCYQELCMPQLIDDIIKCEPVMGECTSLPDGTCETFVKKILDGSCIDGENVDETNPDSLHLETCYGGNTTEEGYTLGLEVVACYGKLMTEQKCNPILNCFPQQWSCKRDSTGGCMALVNAIIFDHTCPPVYTGAALEDCHLSLNSSNNVNDTSFRLGSELLTCIQHDCWDECHDIGGFRDSTRQVCLSPGSCNGVDCGETAEDIVNAGVSCDQSLSPPCTLVKGLHFSVNYYQESAPAEGTLCQSIINNEDHTDSFFVLQTLFNLDPNGFMKGETCIIVDTITGVPPTFIGVYAKELIVAESNFFPVLAGETVETCVDLFLYYDLLNNRKYDVSCPSRLLNYIDVITLHTNGAGLGGPMQGVPFTTNAAVNLLAMQSRPRIQDREKYNWVLNEVRLLGHCTPIEFSGCTTDQQNSINSEYHDACDSVANSKVYGTPDPNDDLADDYFRQKTGLSTVQTGMIAIRSLLQQNSRVTCGGSSCASNTYAYVSPGDYYHVIHLCQIYWDIPSERTVTIVHEAGHFTDVAGLDDVKYGCTDCLNLGASDAQRNADNWGFYVDDFCKDDRDCFAANALVTTKTRGQVEIQNLNIGDQVLAVNREGHIFFDDIYLKAHFHPLLGSERFTTMLEFIFSNNSSTRVSPGHLVYLKNQGDSVIGQQHCMTLHGQEACTYQAWEATVGSTIFVNGLTQMQPKHIEQIMQTREKIRNIFTLSGNVFVDNVLVSCYEKNYATVHSELWVFRFLYELSPFIYQIVYSIVYLPFEFFTHRFIVLTGSLAVTTNLARILMLVVIFALKVYVPFWTKKRE